MSNTLKLSWLRFGFCLGVIGIFPTLLIASNINNRDSWSTTAAVLLLFLSLVSFFSLGWIRLRRENAAKPIPVTEAGWIIKLLIGPVVTAVIWFVSTIIVIIVFVVASMLAGRAA